MYFYMHFYMGTKTTLAVRKWLIFVDLVELIHVSAK